MLIKEKNFTPLDKSYQAESNTSDKSYLIGLIKNLSKKVITGIIFGVAIMIGVVAAVAFTEPISGPTGFNEPTNAQDQGDWFAYGRGWLVNSSGDGSSALTKAVCDTASDWYWFEDGSGDGDETDEEDGICVLSAHVISKSWNGDDDANAGYRDNTYIASYECEGSFPNGTITVGTYRGIDNVAALTWDTTWDNGDCALCQADCYDGKRDLPENPYLIANHYLPSEAIAGHNGDLTPEVLKSWTGTRLPTSNDFFGFCGATDGDADSTAGDSLYHASGASTDTSIGNYGKNMGRGTSSEYMDLSNSTWEWLSEQHHYYDARVAGAHACSVFGNGSVYVGYRFRAVFRP